MGLNNNGVKSLINCIPSSIALNLPKAIPNPIPDVEFHGNSVTDHTGNPLLNPPIKQVKDVYEFANNTGVRSAILIYRDRLRDVLLESVPVQWGKKCTGYEEIQEGVWVFFEDGSREFCDILVGADGVNSPGNAKILKCGLFILFANDNLILSIFSRSSKTKNT